jgi:hypothetical protein
VTRVSGLYASEPLHNAPIGSFVITADSKPPPLQHLLYELQFEETEDGSFACFLLHSSTGLKATSVTHIQFLRFHYSNLSMALQPFLGPWLLFQFLDPIYSW